ncbi:MAG: hypothetical protein ACTSSN_13875 [Candidatus Heimdallarchaeaceae archaeon]
MSVKKFFDDMEVDNFLWLSAAFVILFASGFVIGFIRDYLWMVILAAVVAGLFLIWCSMYIIINWQELKKEKEILVELPSFPEPDFCDMCSKELEGGERRTDGEFLIIICPHCEAENIVSSEAKIQEVEKTIEGEEE